MSRQECSRTDALWPRGGKRLEKPVSMANTLVTARKRKDVDESEEAAAKRNKSSSSSSSSSASSSAGRREPLIHRPPPVALPASPMAAAAAGAVVVASPPPVLLASGRSGGAAAVASSMAQALHVIAGAGLADAKALFKAASNRPRRARRADAPDAQTRRQGLSGRQTCRSDWVRSHAYSRAHAPRTGARMFGSRFVPVHVMHRTFDHGGEIQCETKFHERHLTHAHAHVHLMGSCRQPSSRRDSTRCNSQ